MQFWIVPVGAMHGCFEVVDYQPTRHATKVMERVFDRCDEVVGGLPVNDFAVSLSAAA